jgi:phage gp29-like protein
MAKAPTRGEIAVSRDTLDITRGYVNEMALLMPQDDILQLRGAGDYELYRKVLQDWQVAACWQQRRRALLGREWEVTPGGKDKVDIQAADFAREMVTSLGWDRLTDGMLHGVFYGYAVAEVIWGRDGKHVIAEDVRVRDRRRFAFDGAHRLRLLTMSSPNPGELMPDRKFWHFSTGADHDDEPYGLGIATWLYWPVWFKRNGLRAWLIFLDKFGQPTGLGTHPPNATMDERQKLLDAARAIATNTGVVIPEGMRLELLEAKRSGTSDYAALHDRMDKAIAKVILGQSLTTEAEGGQYKADVQMEVRQEIVKADSDLICGSFRHSVLTWLVEWNFPGAKVPFIGRVLDEPEDLDAKAERIDKLGRVGFRPTLAQVVADFGGEWVEAKLVGVGTGSLRQPQDGQEFSEAALTPASLPGAQAERLAGAAVPLEAALVEPIRALLGEVGSLEEFSERLLDVFPDMPSDALASLLGQALMSTTLAGRSDVRAESGDA